MIRNFSEYKTLHENLYIWPFNSAFAFYGNNAQYPAQRVQNFKPATFNAVFILNCVLAIHFEGSFCGGLSTLPAHDLGTICIKEALGRAGIKGENVSEVILGQVLTAGTCTCMKKDILDRCIFGLISYQFVLESVVTFLLLFLWYMV